MQIKIHDLNRPLTSEVNTTVEGERIVYKLSFLTDSELESKIDAQECREVDDFQQDERNWND